MTENAVTATEDVPQRWSWYQIWVLVVLLLVGMLNYADRSLVAIVQEPMKRDLGLSDTQIGIILGPAFAIVYAGMAIPLGRLAERVSRVRILTIAVALWSAMTALAGFSRSFGHLIATRCGVGIGESGATPTSHALAADYFMPKQRGLAISILSMSIPLGAVLGLFLGGVIAQSMGWRHVFFWLGIPGLVLAALVWLTIEEPVRGRLDTAPPARPGSLLADGRLLLLRPGFAQLLLGNAFAAMALYGIRLFSGSFLIRRFGFTLAEAGTTLAIAAAVGAIGTLIGGYVATRRLAKDKGAFLTIPAFACAIGVVFLLLLFTSQRWELALVFVVFGYIFTEMNGTVYAAVQNIAPPHLRVTAGAINMAVTNGVGGTIGPMVVGIISDRVAAGSFPAHLGDYAAQCHRAGGISVKAVAQACGEASAHGVTTGLLASCALLLWGAGHFYASSRALRRAA